MKIIVGALILVIMLGCSVEIVAKIRIDFPNFIQQPFDFEEMLKEFLVYLPLLGIILVCLFVGKQYLLTARK